MAPPPQPKKEDKPTIPKEKIPEILAAVEKHSNGGHIKMNDLADKLDLRSDVYIKYINDLVRHYGLLRYQTDQRTGNMYVISVGALEKKKTKEMTVDELAVYQSIKDAGDKGIFKGHLKHKAGVSEVAANKILTKFEGKNLIKQVRDMKKPTQKTYMLYDTEPHISLTGGIWYDKGVMDTDFVANVLAMLEKHIKSKSAPRKHPIGTIAKEQYVPNPIFPPSHTNKYASPATCLEYLKAKQIVRTGVELTKKDITTVMRVFVFDGKVEILKFNHESANFIEGWNSDLENGGGGMDSDEETEFKAHQKKMKEKEKERRAREMAVADDEDDEMNGKRKKKRSRKVETSTEESDESDESDEIDRKSRKKKSRSKDKEESKSDRKKRKEKERKKKERAKEKEREKKRKNRKVKDEDDSDDSDESDDELVSVNDKRGQKRKRSSGSGKSSGKRSKRSKRDDSSSDVDSSSDSSEDSSSDSDDIDTANFLVGGKGPGGGNGGNTQEVSHGFNPFEGFKEDEYDLLEDLDVYYRWILPTRSLMGISVSEAPCARCPTFDFCSEKGPVNPSGCGYYEDWLEMPDIESVPDGLVGMNGNGK